MCRPAHGYGASQARPPWWEDTLEAVWGPEWGDGRRDISALIGVVANGLVPRGLGAFPFPVARPLLVLTILKLFFAVVQLSARNGPHLNCAGEDRTDRHHMFLTVAPHGDWCSVVLHFSTSLHLPHVALFCSILVRIHVHMFVRLHSSIPVLLFSNISVMLCGDTRRFCTSTPSYLYTRTLPNGDTCYTSMFLFVCMSMLLSCSTASCHGCDFVVCATCAWFHTVTLLCVSTNFASFACVSILPCI